MTEPVLITVVVGIAVLAIVLALWWDAFRDRPRCGRTRVRLHDARMRVQQARAECRRARGVAYLSRPRHRWSR